MALSFERLRKFTQNRMRMSHIYQPVMIRELLTKGGIASVRDIASAFLSRDESQLEYYEQSPRECRSKHGVVEHVARKTSGLRWTRRRCRQATSQTREAAFEG